MLKQTLMVVYLTMNMWCYFEKRDWKPRFLSALKIRPVVPKKNFYLATNTHFTKEQEFEKHPKDEYRSVTQTHPLITSRPLRFYLLTLWTQLYSKLYIKDVKTRDSLIHLSSGSVGFRFLNLDILPVLSLHVWQIAVLLFCLETEISPR